MSLIHLSRSTLSQALGKLVRLDCPAGDVPVAVVSTVLAVVVEVAASARGAKAPGAAMAPATILFINQTSPKKQQW